MKIIIILYAIIVLVNIFWVFGFFVRLVGIETMKWSISNTIYQIINIIPQAIGLIQVPMITLFTETAINKNQILTSSFYQKIILYNFLGTFIGLFLMPLFMNYMKYLINILYEESSSKKFITYKLLKEFNFKFSKNNFNRYFSGRKFKFGYFYILNTVIGYLLAIAFPLCVYIGYQIPAYRASLISLVSVIIGFATILNIFFIELKISITSDKIINNLLDIVVLKDTLFNCILGRLTGILLGLFSLPYISEFALFIIGKTINKF